MIGRSGGHKPLWNLVRWDRLEAVIRAAQRVDRLNERKNPGFIDPRETQVVRDAAAWILKLRQDCKDVVIRRTLKSLDRDGQPISGLNMYFDHSIERAVYPDQKLVLDDMQARLTEEMQERRVTAQLKNVSARRRPSWTVALVTHAHLFGPEFLHRLPSGYDAHLRDDRL
jgi:hypothetical protein